MVQATTMPTVAVTTPKIRLFFRQLMVSEREKMVCHWVRVKFSGSKRDLPTSILKEVVRMVANRNPDSPYLFPILQSEEGTEAAYREYQSALRGFNQRLAVLRQCLGMQSALSTYAARHTWATMAYHCEIHPGIISEAMGHSSITVTETYLKPFSNRKIDEANQRVISFVRSGACTV